MWRRVAIACGAASCLAVSTGSSASSVILHAVDGAERFAIERAVSGASQRLENPDCQRVLTDFTDASGRTLAENLVQFGKTPVEFFNELYWVDDRETPCCLRRGTLAFTAPGHRVIRVCGRRFAEVSQSRPIYGDAILIHEMLHALGLGEKPPSSSDITRQVLARCS